MITRLGAVALSLVACGSALAQTTMLVQDTFVLGPRPQGGNGRERDVFVHTSLNGYWTTFPGTDAERWVSGNNDPEWIFSASSVDALEWPEALPGDNGTASGQGHSTALVPFAPPSSSFAVHLDTIHFYGFSDGVKVGFTSSTVVNDNFAFNSDLYIEFRGTGSWKLMTRRQAAPLLEGDISPLYRLSFGWVPITLSYDPATRRVGGMVNGEVLGPVTLGFDPVITHAGFEAIADIIPYMTVNNFLVRRGTERLIASEPSGWTGRPGENAVFGVTSAEGLVSWRWRRNGQELADGPTAWGSTVTGAGSATLVIENVGADDEGDYDCLLVAPSGSDLSASVPLSTGGCAADFDHNGFVNGDDFDGFVFEFYWGTMGADFDGNGFVNGDDFDGFMGAFAVGC